MLEIESVEPPEGLPEPKRYLTRNEEGQVDTQSEAAQTEEIARARYGLSAYELDKAVRQFKRRDAVDESDDDGGRLAGLKQVILG